MKPTIMIVDDSSVLRRSVVRTIRMSGAEAVEAGSVAQALDVRNVNWIHGWILDWNLPDGTGLEILDILRGDGSHSPVLLITGHPSIALANQAAVLGAIFHAKPVPPEVVITFIDRTRHTIPVVQRLSNDLGLTSREHAIVTMRLNGICRAGLAPSLGITEDAVKSRIRAILKKAKECGYAFDTVDDLLLDVHRRTGDS